jgi:biopolymer transport protein ExbD
MKINLHTPVEEVQIQIIPLIDVIFCVLTFFLLAALQFTRQQAINVDLPKASTGTSSPADSQIAGDILPVTIDAVGQIYIEKNPVRKEELAQKLSEYIQANPKGILVLNASRSATYNDVIETLDLLRQVGGNRVSLGIIPGPSQPLTDSSNLAPATSLPPPPVLGASPQNNFNYLPPSTTNQFPAIGQDGNASGISTTVPHTLQHQGTALPGKTKTAHRR